MFLHGNERTVNLLGQFTNTVLSRLQELQTSNIFKHQYGSDSMLTNEVKDLIYSYNHSRTFQSLNCIFF